MGNSFLSFSLSLLSLIRMIRCFFLSFSPLSLCSRCSLFLHSCFPPPVFLPFPLLLPLPLNLPPLPLLFTVLHILRGGLKVRLKDLPVRPILLSLPLAPLPLFSFSLLPQSALLTSPLFLQPLLFPRCLLTLNHSHLSCCINTCHLLFHGITSNHNIQRRSTLHAQGSKRLLIVIQHATSHPHNHVVRGHHARRQLHTQRLGLLGKALFSPLQRSVSHDRPFGSFYAQPLSQVELYGVFGITTHDAALHANLW